MFGIARFFIFNKCTFPEFPFLLLLDLCKYTLGNTSKENSDNILIFSWISPSLGVVISVHRSAGPLQAVPLSFNRSYSYSQKSSSSLCCVLILISCTGIEQIHNSKHLTDGKYQLVHTISTRIQLANKFFDCFHTDFYCSSTFIYPNNLQKSKSFVWFPSYIF
jgi:hypothetical protein